MSDRATAFAPASIGNLGVGFDMLGLALDGAGDRVTVRRTSASGVTVNQIRGSDGEPHAQLSSRADENTASIAAQSLWSAHGEGGIEIDLFKGVPLQSGMGSSAASAVAAVVAANALLDTPLDTAALLVHALEGEQYASKGLHADNVAPSLFGGLVLCPQVLFPDVVQLPVPAGVSAVLLHPELRVNTAEARRGLRQEISMSEWIEQQACLAAFVAACHSGDIDLIGRSLRDVVIEPQRAGRVACFDAVVEAAKQSGALGTSLSGSGPSIFALCRDADANGLADVMETACRAHGIECQSWISPMASAGARIEELS